MSHLHCQCLLGTHVPCRGLWLGLVDMTTVPISAENLGTEQPSFSFEKGIFFLLPVLAYGPAGCPVGRVR